MGGQIPDWPHQQKRLMRLAYLVFGDESQNWFWNNKRFLEQEKLQEMRHHHGETVDFQHLK
jgi:hypothetical protein